MCDATVCCVLMLFSVYRPVSLLVDDNCVKKWFLQHWPPNRSDTMKPIIGVVCSLLIAGVTGEYLLAENLLVVQRHSVECKE